MIPKVIIENIRYIEHKIFTMFKAINIQFLSIYTYVSTLYVLMYHLRICKTINVYSYNEFSSFTMPTFKKRILLITITLVKLETLHEISPFFGSFGSRIKYWCTIVNLISQIIKLQKIYCTPNEISTYYLFA